MYCLHTVCLCMCVCVSAVCHASVREGVCGYGAVTEEHTLIAACLGGDTEMEKDLPCSHLMPV